MAAVELLHPKTLILNLALAAAYGLIGWAATLLALSPGHALPIFPSAGLALAAVLVGGSRMYPGVYVGSLTVVWLVGTAAGGSAHPWALALVPTAKTSTKGIAPRATMPGASTRGAAAASGFAPG